MNLGRIHGGERGGVDCLRWISEKGVVERGDATGGGAVFSSDGPLYNSVLRKKLIGLFCGGCEGRPAGLQVRGLRGLFSYFF